jgi:uncharacterized protein YggU (UPF0235/DUF167 family)
LGPVQNPTAMNRVSQQHLDIASKIVDAFISSGIRIEHTVDANQAVLTIQVTCRVHPGSKIELIKVNSQGELVCHLKAKPIEGAANRSLTKLLGSALGVAPSNISIKRGGQGRIKSIQLDLLLNHPKSRKGERYIEKIEALQLTK